MLSAVRKKLRSRAQKLKRPLASRVLRAQPRLPLWHPDPRRTRDSHGRLGRDAPAFCGSSRKSRHCGRIKPSLCSMPLHSYADVEAAHCCHFHSAQG